MGSHHVAAFVLPGWIAVAGMLRAQAATAAPPAPPDPVVVGRVVDRDGEPVAGCAVGIVELGGAFDTNELLAAPLTTTDDAGRYRVTVAGRQSPMLVIAAKGHQTCVMPVHVFGVDVKNVPDTPMLPGTTLRGRVRGPDGKPLAGALVRVEDPLLGFRAVTMWFESRARCDERGIFEVVGVPRTGLRVTVCAPGFAPAERFAAHGSPLDVSLTPTGFVRGTVVDEHGAPLPDVPVWVVTAESWRDPTPARTDAAGRFVVTAPPTPRFRVAARATAQSVGELTSGLLHGPADDVVVTGRPGEAPPVKRVTLRCVDAVTGASIDEFDASWSSVHSRASVHAVLHHPVARVRYRGEATIAVGHDIGDKRFGTLVVDAPGRGLVVVPVPDDPTEPLVAALPVEGVLVGQVVDAETGKPAANCAVRALPAAGIRGGGPDPWLVGAITDADGRYRLGGLGPGDHDVQVYGRGRPASLSSRTTMREGEQTTLDLRVPRERWLAFELAGDVPKGCLGVVVWQSFSSGSAGTMLSARMPVPAPMPLVGPCQRKIGPLGDGQFRAILSLPTRDRLGCGLTVDLGEVEDGTVLQLPALRQTLHTGRVELPSDVPAERIALVAHPIRVRKRDNAFFTDLLEPFTVGLGTDGTFAIDLPPGHYALQLADVESGLVFHTESDDHELGLGAEPSAAALVLRPECRWLDVSFEPTVKNGEVVCSRVTLDAERPRDGKLPAMLGPDNHGGPSRRSSGWQFRPGTRSLRWLVPGGTLQLGATQTWQNLSPISNGWTNGVVATVDVVVDAREQTVTLRVPPVPDDATLLAGPKQ